MAPGVATVITQLSNVILRAIEQDRKTREIEEHGERLAALEDALERGHAGLQRPAA